MSLFGSSRKGAADAEKQSAAVFTTFEQELTELVNKYNLESLSNTPDFILSYYIKDCLLAFNNAQQRRKEWFAAREEGKTRDSQMAPL